MEITLQKQTNPLGLPRQKKILPYNPKLREVGIHDKRIQHFLQRCRVKD